MALDQKKLRGLVDANKERRSGMRYLKKNATTNLRILTYKDADGSEVFAQPVVEHRQAGGANTKGNGYCRLDMFKQPCALCRVNQQARDGGEQAPFQSRTRYVVNAIDVDNDPKSVRRFLLPSSVFGQIADFLTDDQWADLLDAKVGVCLAITSSGSGLDTEYSTKPHRKPYPVSADLLKLSVDPMTEIKDPGLESQCDSIGVSLSDLFDESELAQYDPEALKPIKDKPKANGKPKPAPKADPEPEPEPTSDLEEGDKVNYGGDTETVYTLKSINGDDVEIEDEGGNVFTATMADLTRAEVAAEPEPEPEPEVEVDEYAGGDAVGKTATIEIKGKKYHGTVEGHAENGAIKLRLDNKSLLNCNIKALTFDDDAPAEEQQPKCFGDSTMYNADDEECQKCTFSEECAGNTELDAAGLGKGKPVAKSSKPAPAGANGRQAAGANKAVPGKPVGKTAAPTGGKSAKDLVAGILGKNKK